MTTAHTFRTRQIIGRVRRIWGELDYAQRRVLEMRTGIPVSAARCFPGPPGPRRQRRGSVEELEALYAYEPRR